jgi:hypothetical protein
MCTLNVYSACHSSFFSPNYIFYKIELVDKGYGINFNIRETLQHYVTLLHPLFCAQKHYHIFIFNLLNYYLLPSLFNDLNTHLAQLIN